MIYKDTSIDNILVTGGCGFVGANLVNYLCDKNYNLKVFDNLSSGSIQNLESTGINLDKIEIIKGDITDREAVKKALKNIDAVVHLAAETSVVDSLQTPVEHWNINVSGTLNVLEEGRINKIKAFILASSNAVLGEQEPPACEVQVPQPLSPYGATKMAGEALCSAYYNSYGLPAYCLRFSNCYGPYSYHKTSVISLFLQYIKENKTLTIYGDGNQTRDFIHVLDICQAIHLCLKDATQSGKENKNASGEIFQIASGKETSVNELVELLSSLANKEISVVHSPARKGEIIRNYSDISKARACLKFNPQIDLKDGLAALWNQYNEKQS